MRRIWNKLVESSRAIQFLVVLAMGLALIYFKSLREREDALRIGRNGHLLQDGPGWGQGRRRVGVLVRIDTNDDVDVICQHGIAPLPRGVVVVGSGPNDAVGGL